MSGLNIESMSLANRKNNLNFTDEEIVQLILDTGNNDLYARLYDKYQKKVFSKCMTLLKSEGLANEFTKEIFSKVFESLPSFRNKSSFSSWLYAVTTNHCIDFLRNKKKLHYPKWDRENELPDIIDESSDEMPVFNYDDLMKVLELIHPEEKALILMKYQDNLSLKEIGQSLRVTEDAAKMRLKRAKARIVFLFKKEFIDKRN
jgi:RNA polymerase sigma factor (sigma-70 family)